jgi:MFS transporter, Spinster family, sphingosine-1-phosphate transporter
VSRTLLLLTLLNVVHYLDRFVISALAPAIQEDMAVGNFQLGILMSAFMVGYVISCPFFGMLGDRFSRPKLMTLGALLWSLATIMSAMTSGFLSLVAMRVLAGVGGACFATIAPVFVRARLRDDKSVNEQFTIFYLAIPLGAALGYWFGGFFGDLYNWNFVFVFAGVPGLVLGLMVWRIGEVRDHGTVRQRTLSFSNWWSDIRQLVQAPEYRSITIGYIFYTFSLAGIAAWVPYYGVNVLGQPLQEVTTIFALIMLITATLGTYYGGRLGQIFVSRGLSVEGFTLFCSLVTLLSIPFVVAAFMTETSYYFYGFVFVGLMGMFAVTAPINTALLSSAPSYLTASALALSIFLVHILGDLLGPPLVGLMSEYMHFSHAVIILPLSALVGGMIWWSCSRQGFSNTIFAKENYPLSPMTLGMSRIVRFFIRRVMNIFFGELSVLHSEDNTEETLTSSHNDELQGPTLLIANHPNALIDAVVVFCTSRQNLRLVGKSTLWNMAVLRPFLKLAGAVPVYRKIDAGEKLHEKALGLDSNDDAIIEVARALRRYSFVIYPEGISHEGTQLATIRTGGARMLLTAAYLSRNEGLTDRGSADIDITRMGFRSVGLYFEQKWKFRSRAVVHYGRRFKLDEIFDSEQMERIAMECAPTDLVQILTDSMQKELKLLVPEAKDEESLEYLQNLASLMIGNGGKYGIKEKYRWEVMIKEIMSEAHLIPPEHRLQTRRKVRDYFTSVKSINVTDHFVSQVAERKVGFYIGAVVKSAMFMVGSVIFSPFIFLGYILYYWIALGIKIAVDKFAPDLTEVGSYKFLAGMLIIGTMLGCYCLGFAALFATKVNIILGIPAGLVLPLIAGQAVILFHEQIDDQWRLVSLLFSSKRRKQLDELTTIRGSLTNSLLEVYEQYIFSQSD